MSFNSANLTPQALFKMAPYLWLISLCLPALYYDNEIYFGYETLVLGITFGWLGLVFQSYSNLSFLLALYMIKHQKNPIKLAAFTFILGFSSLFVTQIMATGDKGVYDSDIELKAWGFGFWITSYGVLFIATVWSYYIEQNKIKIR